MLRVSVRYMVADVNQAVSFYTQQLGFQLDVQPNPAVANLSLGNLRLLLNQPCTDVAKQSALDGSVPGPGGWNRIQLEVDDLQATVEQLKKAGCYFRSEIIQGSTGQHIVLDDPSGNPVELFQHV